MCRNDQSSSIAAAGGREILPTNVKPTHYDLSLEPDLEKFTYNGKVIIDLEVVEDSTSIALNSIDITVQEAKVLSDGAVLASSPKISSDEKAQTMTLSFDKTFSKGSRVKLDLDFTGILNNNMAGFYRSSYTAKDGSKKFMATTQMEPTDARRAFPCFDEPALKASFAVTLIADKGLTCLSNMDEKSVKEVQSSFGGAMKNAVTFNPTPPMSTYLLAFIIGELNYVESKKFRVPVRVYAPPDQDIERGRFSADIGARTLAFYEEKFDSKFPLPKMDMIAVPDFSAGAMENWGLVTYRDVLLMYDEKTSGASSKKLIVEVVQHELAHQWFGNLVTMDFWEGLWLNEGFATWMSWYSVNAFYPEWKVWEGYVTDVLQDALSLDSLRSSHPIEVPIKRADEINQIFDSISYAKGSCVLRMISQYLGEETFLKGIKHYLKKHAYSNTKTEDLWAALSSASGKDVQKVMEIWTKNVGYPVVTVTEDKENSSIHVKQNRFLRTSDVKPEEDKTLFPVFLGLRSKDGVDEQLTLFEREATFKVPSMEFYKINANHSGLYRTFYDSDRLGELGKQAKAGLLSTEDRAGMIADAGALSASGYQRSSGTLSLLKGFSEESEFVVWEQVLAVMSSLRSAWIFESEETKAALKTLSRKLASAKSHELGWKFEASDKDILQQFKAMMFTSAALAGDEKVIAAAKDMFEKFCSGDRSAIHPNIRTGVYAIVMQYNGSDQVFDKLLDEYRNAKTSDERTAALGALGKSNDPKLIKRAIDYAMGDEVRLQDMQMPLRGLRSHRDGIEALWKAVQDNWEMLVKRLPAGLGKLGDVVQMSTSAFTSTAQMAEVEKFFEGKDTKGYDQGLAQSLDSIRAKAKWVERDAKDVEDWLKSEKYA